MRKQRPLIHFLLRVGKLTHDRVRGRMQQIGLHRGQGRLLHTLHRMPGATQRELADGMGITPATTTTMLKRMEEQGLISRQRDPQDDRAMRINMTTEGQIVHKQSGVFWDELEARIEDHFEEQELVVLREYLERLASCLSQDDSEDC